jgi:hypothetical protein
MGLWRLAQVLNRKLECHLSCVHVSTIFLFDSVLHCTMDYHSAHHLVLNTLFFHMPLHFLAGTRLCNGTWSIAVLHQAYPVRKTVMTVTAGPTKQPTLRTQYTARIYQYGTCGHVTHTGLQQVTNDAVQRQLQTAV